MVTPSTCLSLQVKTKQRREIGLEKKVCEDLLNEGCMLYVNNFYTFYNLSIFLQKKHIVGTVRSKAKKFKRRFGSMIEKR